MRGVRKYVLLGMLLPGLAWGADVRLSIGGSVEYDDNISRSESNKQDDVVFRVTPQIRLVEDREKLNYSVGYMLPYEIGVTNSAVNDLNQLADANFRYRATPQTEVFGNDGFYYVHGLFSQDQNLQDPTLGDVGDERNQVLQNNVSLGVRHLFTPRLSGTVLVNNGVYDTNQFARSNVISYGGSASSEYQVTPHHLLGGGLSFSRQMFDQTFNRPASDTDYYNLFGSWEWLFDETTSFNIQADPALIHSTQDAPPPTIANQQPIPFTGVGDQFGRPIDSVIVVNAFASCPIVDTNPLFFDNAGNRCGQVILADDSLPSPQPGAILVPTATLTGITSLPLTDLDYLPGDEPEAVNDTRLTYFANASLTKRWTPTLASSLAYTRQENGAAGIDGGAVLDAITLSNSWRISERWDAAVRADWTQRKSATDGGRVFVIAASQPVVGLVGGVAATQNAIQIDSADSLDTQRWGMAARVAYRLTKNTVTALQYAYNKQSSKGDTVGQDSDFDNHLVTFTVQYNFEPIGLWW